MVPVQAIAGVEICLWRRVVRGVVGRRGDAIAGTEAGRKIVRGVQSHVRVGKPRGNVFIVVVARVMSSVTRSWVNWLSGRKLDGIGLVRGFLNRVKW